MKKLCFLSISLLFAASTAFAQFRNDNVLYKTVFPQDLCTTLQHEKNYLLLDVRSKGEFEDTSSSPGYNLGHLKNAVNINVRELGNRLSEIAAYKDQPVYVYCSHSQRSRRASKMLTDSGFTNVTNINGGVTAIRQLPEDNCVNNYLVTKVGYDIIALSKLCKKLAAGDNKTFILDVRSDSAFRRIDLNANVNSFGQIKNSVNIPLADLPNRLAEIPAGKDIIAVDLFGDDAARAAAILHDHSYKNVSTLLEGMDRLYFTDSRDQACLKNYYTSPVKYTIMNSADFRRFTEQNTDYLVLDVRPLEEFANRHKEYWRNIGHIVNAVNIPSSELKDKIIEIEKYRNKPVFVYTFSAGKEAHEAANVLVNRGFTNVNILAGGLFNLRWTSNNVPGNSSLSKMVTDIPAENL
ncbi:MAG: rhodanese-like domain-containing protein [Ferruginibacter sp.]